MDSAKTPEEQDIINQIYALQDKLKIIQQQNVKKSLVTIQNKTFYMDGFLRKNLDHLNIAVANKWDGILVVDGMEGTGKTTFTFSMAHYVSNGKFTLDDVFYAPEEFEKWVDQATPGGTGVWDEFVLGGMSEEALTKMQIAIIKKMTLIRKKRLKIFLLIPYIFMLRTYFAVARPRALIHVYSPDGLSRGYFTFFNYEQKRYLYFKNKKTWAYTGVDHSFRGRFTDYEDIFIDAKEYDKKKDKAIKDTSKDSAAAWKNRTISSVKYLWNFVKPEHPNLINQKTLGEWYGVNERQIRRWLTDGRT